MPERLRASLPHQRASARFDARSAKGRAMPGLLIQPSVLAQCRDEIARIADATGVPIEPIEVPGEGERLDEASMQRITLALSTISGSNPGGPERRFFGAATRAPNLRWLHVSHAGIDDPVFGRLLDQGVRISNSSGASAEPIAQTAIGGLLALARGFPAWAEAQRAHEWRPHERQLPELRGQTLVVVGLGAIGGHIARLGQALGLHVIGVRRSPRREDDTIDELVTPEGLAQVLPRAEWLALAVPLTDQTRGLIDAPALASLPPGARILNVARGEVIEEEAMIEALRSGALGGAYLDVFAEEPLPPSSPLWDLPNVIVSPHSSASSTGNAARALEIFLDNLERWVRDEPLENEVSER
jgi:phosphoglycerate dehydrogenase-like enzyme